MRTVECENLIFDQDVPITVSDGNVLRANVFRPKSSGHFPVIMALGVYGKDLHFEDGFERQWRVLLDRYPDLCSEGSTGRFLRWETADPERWVPHGYVVIQVDARGSGKSPGFLDPRSPREMTDYYDCIEWAAVQPWANGNVGLLGISYYAVTQWRVAALQPPSLKAICPWEGWVDYYRDSSHQGGILASGFANYWWPQQCLRVQHGNGDCPHVDRETGEPITGRALDPEKLKANRTNYPQDILDHPLDDAWWQERTARLDRINIPVFSAGNWSGPGIHLRGNIEGYQQVASQRKWLSMHDGKHWESFYLPRYVEMQRQFFDRFLKEEDNGWEERAPVEISVRTPEGSFRREEDEFPPARTEYTLLRLDIGSNTLQRDAGAAAQASFDAMAGHTMLQTDAFAADTEITGYVTLKLFAASSTEDMDLFVTLHAIDPVGNDLIFDGAHEPTPMAKGWLRASQRKLDRARTLPHRPFHAHDEVQPLVPGQVYELDIEIWPTSFLFPAGWRLGLRVAGVDFEYPDMPGRLLHKHPEDRGRPQFAGMTTIYSGGDRPSALMVPVVPPKQ
jgi:predicted acyl esterase